MFKILLNAPQIQDQMTNPIMAVSGKAQNTGFCHFDFGRNLYLKLFLELRSLGLCLEMTFFRHAHYINSYCLKCKTSLVFADLLENPETPENEMWYDEFICPKCQDGIYMDWPEEKYKETFEQDDEGNEEFKNFKFELLDKIRTRNSNKVNLKELESDIKEAINQED